ncbi:MAG: DUF5719 family protein [Actinomycetota bacterium]
MASRHIFSVALTRAAIVAVLLAATVLSLLAVPRPERAAAAVPIDRNRIKQVIYPTFGYPQISRCGDQFTLEFDPRDQDWSQPLTILDGFTVFANASNTPYAVHRQLRVDSFSVGYSARWPEYSQQAQPKALLYLVRVTVPGNVPYDLYDLTVNGHRPDGGWISDSQPHALQVIEAFKDDFNLCQLTDIHVWGPEAHSPGSNATHQRNYRHADYREEDGYGAEYYHKAIQQVNLQKPDVCIFTGDFDFSQKWLYEHDYAAIAAYANTPWNGYYYEPWFEMDWFYEETLKLDVPVFILPGNHDGYARYNLDNSRLEEDYLTSWRDLFGPQYFSFNYGPDYHFTALNTMDWTSSQRNLHWLIPDEMLRPGKWQGQLRGGGDAFQAGWSQAREDAIDLSKLTGQLAWARDDLAAHTGAKMRTIAQHHDPWKTAGSGSMFDDADMFGIRLGGRGEGRLAAIKLARTYDVSLVISGHDHSDSYGSIPWAAGGGEVKYVNTTCTMFQDAPNILDPKWDKMWVYPGYRTIHVSNGNVVNFYYKLAGDQNGNPLQYSWPFYAGTNVGGESNFNNMIDAEVSHVWDPVPGEAEDVTCTITNHLCGYEVVPGGEWSGDLRGAFLEFPMPYLSGGYYYTVTGGGFGEVYDSDSPGSHRICQVYTDVGHAPDESTPTVKDVSVEKSAAPDTQAPACTTFQIDGGAASTDVAQVTLGNDAVDPGGAGLMDMMVSNDDPTFTGCVWQRYEASVSWTLQRLGGLRTVYIKFRDAAMPGNVSPTYAASITLVGSAPQITSVDPSPAHTGDTVTVSGSDFGAPRTLHDNVFFNGVAAEVTSWTDTAIACAVPHSAVTGNISVANDAGSASSAFHVLPRIDSVTPDWGYNNGFVDIGDLEGSGFYASGAHPVVTLTNGTDVISATGVSVDSFHTISCRFDLRGADAGFYSLTVQNADGGSDTLHGGFTVDFPPPTVTGITPNWCTNTGPITIEDIAGAHFRSGAAVELRREGAVIDATGVDVVSPQKITCDVDLSGAALGAWDVVVINPDLEEGVLTGGFTVSNPTFYFAEGTCRPDFEPYLCIQNPGESEAEVEITYMKGNGTTVVQNINVSARTRTTVVPRSELGTGDDAAHDFSMKVECTNGRSIVAERPMYFNYGGVWTGGHDVMGIPAPRTAFYFAEGTCRPDFAPYLCIQNPGDAQAAVKITYLKGDGTQDTQEVSVAANSRLTVDPRSELGTGDDAAHDFSMKVECTNGRSIVAERPMYFNYGGVWTGGHDVMGIPAPRTAFYFAEGYTGQGFDEYLCLANPGQQAANAHIAYMFNDGGTQEQDVAIAPASRTTVSVNTVVGPDREVSVEVTSDAPIVAERPMYFDYRGMWTGGHCVVGAAAPAGEWLFAEGYTGTGFEEWLCLYNPGDAPSNVTVTYMPQGGEAFTRDHMVPARSRYTIAVNQDAGSDLQLSCGVRVSSGPPIIAERPMYFDYNGAWTGGHDVVGFRP